MVAMTIDSTIGGSSGLSPTIVSAEKAFPGIMHALPLTDPRLGRYNNSEFAVRFPPNGTWPLAPIPFLCTWHAPTCLGGAVSSPRPARRCHPAGPTPPRPGDFRQVTKKGN